MRKGMLISVIVLCLDLTVLAQVVVPFVQITRTTNAVNGDPSINFDGTRLAFISDANLTGENADRSLEVFLWTAGVGLRQITDTDRFCLHPSISADGTRIAFISNFDFTGENPDANAEVFLWIENRTPNPFVQITQTTGGGLKAHDHP